MRRANGQSGAGHAPPDSPAPDRINALAELPIGDLRQAWQEVWGAPPPKSARRRLLMLGIAWKCQAAIHGGLPKPLEGRLAALEGSLLRGGPIDGAGSDRTAIPRLMPGARLIRVWKGERHEVQVAESGYLWRGRSWKSPSAIARAITGSRRNGPAFFGLRDGDAA